MNLMSRNEELSDLYISSIAVRRFTPRHVCMMRKQEMRAEFTFSEPCIVIHICKKDQQDDTFLSNLFQLNCPRHVSNK
jgi:hypothetical protein